MADIIVTGVSDYLTGGLDSATVLISNVSPISARHPNGLASAVVQIETVLGSGTSLKGSTADLATRLAIALNNTGTVRLDGFTGLTTDRGLIAVSATQLQVMNHTPIGVVQAFSGSVSPTNWLLCDGQAVSRATYAKLFAVTSTTYGVGDGSTTFNVPDIRGRTIISIDGLASRVTSASTNGANADNLGGVGGTETHTLITAESPAHTHTPDTAIDKSTAGGGGGARGVIATTATTSFVWSSSGGGAAHSNTQPWIALNYIIYAGV